MTMNQVKKPLILWTGHSNLSESTTWFLETNLHCDAQVVLENRQENGGKQRTRDTRQSLREQRVYLQMCADIWTAARFELNRRK